MQTKDQAKLRILELCSESEYGSWGVWSTVDNKTEEELKAISQAIAELIEEKKIIAMEHKFKGDYKEVEPDLSRLKDELRKSMTSHNVDPDNFYWFMATEEGEKEDLRLRVK